MNELSKKALELRRNILTTIYEGGGGHLGGCFSIIDFLLYAYKNFLKISPQNALNEDRDRLILSKGHCCLALYWVLADCGFFDSDLIRGYGKDGAIFAGHPELGKAPGIEASTGSLGHGPSIGVGMAVAAKKKGMFDTNVMVICGDGELNEGSVWEAIMCASQLKLNNFYLVVDNNKLESLDLTNNIISIEPLHERMIAFGFQVERVDGHCFAEIENGLNNLKNSTLPQPRCLILDTIKSKGLSFAELVPKWHFRSPTEQEYVGAMDELTRQGAQL